MTPADPLLRALAPLVARVRTDVTAVKRADGRQLWTHDALTPARLARHLNGGPARGVSQIKAGESVTMVGVLDFDSHGGEVPWAQMVSIVGDVMLSLELLGGAPTAWRSSGGRGVHVYCLWDTPQDAYSVRRWLQDALRSCGLESGTKGLQAGQVEVFPKQDSVGVAGFGNQVVLPLAGESVPLLWCDMSESWIAGERSDALQVVWGLSEAVPVVERPTRAVVPQDGTGVEDCKVLQGLLDAIPNSGNNDLSYDDYMAVLFAIHHETGGSGVGLALAHQVAARSGKYVAEMVDKHWNGAHSDGRQSVRGVGTLRRLAALHGWHEPLDAGAFEDVSLQDDRPPLPAGLATVHDVTQPAMQADSASVPRVARLLAVVDAPKTKRRGIPEAQHLVTDQANANRLVNAFGRQVLVAAGRWHVWDGRRWLADEADVYRYGCRLSSLIKDESAGVRARGERDEAAGAMGAAKKGAAIADALLKWAVKSEMKGTIEAAIGLARKMLTVDEGELDWDPWALNVLNGIVDLRTGVLRPHNPDEMLTKLVGVRYDPAARCDGWLRALGEICGGDVGLVGFHRRWFGYCLTGLCVEQAFVVHWGPGGNGKSVVLELMAETMGDYAGTAAPGLLVASKGDRHPTEIAALMGRRMVTAHESGEGVVLREDFIKQATGGDKLVGRFMREDFFEFTPTHKIQLLTNHKPAVKGQDAGIWRRVLLVPYGVAFGTEEQVREGVAQSVKDVDLLLRLRDEAEGVLAWRVRGAVEWAQDGLRAPGVVLAASAAYKSEQDRVGQFVAECCEVGAGFEEALTDGMMGGLYPAYVSWCKEGGIYPISKQRFADDVSRVTGGGEPTDRKLTVAGGGRRKVKIVRGVRLLPD